MAVRQPPVIHASNFILLVREAVDRDTSALDPEGQRARFQSMLDDFRQWQTDGELAANLDAAYTGLALFCLAAAPVVFPQTARALGLDPDSDEFATKYAEETTRLVEHLKGG